MRRKGPDEHARGPANIVYLTRNKVYMQKLSLITAGLVVVSLAASAQRINTDSLSIVSKISEYQLKMAKLQNTVQQTTYDKQDAADKVQTSADKSMQDANRLNDDPQNKQLAKN